MIHLGRPSQISRVEAVEPTFDILDSTHDSFQLPDENSATYARRALAHPLPISQAKAHRADLNMSATEVRYGGNAQLDP
jgi:hypothetical protein